MHASPVVRGGDDLILRKWGTCTARTKICQLRRKCCFCQFYKNLPNSRTRDSGTHLYHLYLNPGLSDQMKFAAFQWFVGNLSRFLWSRPNPPAHVFLHSKFPADNRAVSLSTGHSGRLDMLCCVFWTRQLYNWTSISSSNTTHGKSWAIHTDWVSSQTQKLDPGSILASVGLMQCGYHRC